MTPSFKTTFTAGSLLLLGGILLHQTRLIECASNSLKEISYVLVLKGLPLKKGDLVAIKDHQVHHTQESSFLKRILGLPGDSIVLDKNTLQVSSSKLPLLSQSRDGKPLTPQSATRVPEGHAFVGGDHPRSFDSRYEEFGFVPFPKIWGKGILAW